MNTQSKLYVSLGVAAVLVAALVYQNQQVGQEQQAHSLQARSAKLPALDLTEDKVKTIDRVVIRRPSDGEEEPGEVELKKLGEEAWELTKPIAAKASATNVQSLLDNLKKLELSETIATGADSYERWGVADDKAMRATFHAGEETVFDLYLGESGSRGQMARLGASEGVYTLKGISKWLYERDAKGFRDKTIFKFDDKEVVTVKIENESGRYLFEKDGDSWKSTLAKRRRRGFASARGIEGFAKGKVDELLRAFKSLNALDFGDDVQLSDVGLDAPVATVTVELKGGTGHYELRVGATADGSNRWVVSNASPQVFSISSWAANWAVAEPEKFKDAS